MNVRFVALMLCGVFLALTSTVAQSQDAGRPVMSPDQERVAESIIDETMSPYCSARMLHDCPSSQAVELRNVIRQKVVAGESRDQILQYLYTRYGEAVVRALPDRTGKGFIAWAAPWLFALAGVTGAITWLRVRGRGEPEGTAAIDTKPVDPAVQARIDAMVRGDQLPR